MRRIAVVVGILVGIISTPGFAVDQNWKPGFDPSGMSHLMQGNDTYNVRDFQSALPPSTVLGAFKKNLPTITSIYGDKQKDPAYLGIGFTSEDAFPLISNIQVSQTTADQTTSLATVLCPKGPEDTPCAATKTEPYALRITSVIGVCARDLGSSCVDSISLIKSDGTKVSLTPVKQVPTDGYTFPARTELGGVSYPAGAVTTLWSESGKADSLFLIRGSINTVADKVNSKWVGRNPTINFEIIPVVTEKASVVSPRLETFNLQQGTYIPVVRVVGLYPDCVITENGICYHRSTFSPGSNFTVTMRVPNTLSGWLNGRLTNPNATIKPFDQLMDELVITAGPSKNIVAGTFVKSADLNPELFKNSDGTPNIIGINKDQGGVIINGGAIGSLDLYKKWQSALGDSALLIPEAWTLVSIPDSTNSTCKVPGLQGIVTSNATAYSPGPPDWNSELQTLDYKVASPHFAPDKTTVNQGTYGLSMKADLMKCLYNIKSIPSSASISVTNEASGSQNIETVSIGQNGEWVYLAASGFTFSSPTLRVKLNQKVEVAPAVTPTVTPTVAPTANASAAPSKPTMSITCVKGKTTKKVSGSNPKCPAGFKKK